MGQAERSLLRGRPPAARLFESHAAGTGTGAAAPGPVLSARSRQRGLPLFQPHLVGTSLAGYSLRVLAHTPGKVRASDVGHRARRSFDEFEPVMVVGDRHDPGNRGPGAPRSRRRGRVPARPADEDLHGVGADGSHGDGDSVAQGPVSV